MLRPPRAVAPVKPLMNGESVDEDQVISSVSTKTRSQSYTENSPPHDPCTGVVIEEIPLQPIPSQSVAIVPSP